MSCSSVVLDDDRQAKWESGAVRSVLKASFVRTIGERDRIYVVRSDGSHVNWAFPTYGDALPHDLIHLVVEAAFGLAHGFWGRVDAGADPGAIMADANRRGGSNKYSAFGSDRSELLLSEAPPAAGLAAWALVTLVGIMPSAAAGHNAFSVDSPADLRILRTIRFISPTIGSQWPDDWAAGGLALDLGVEREGL